MEQLYFFNNALVDKSLFMRRGLSKHLLYVLKRTLQLPLVKSWVEVIALSLVEFELYF